MTVLNPAERQFLNASSLFSKFEFSSHVIKVPLWRLECFLFTKIASQLASFHLRIHFSHCISFLCCITSATDSVAQHNPHFFLSQIFRVRNLAQEVGACPRAYGAWLVSTSISVLLFLPGTWACEVLSRASGAVQGVHQLPGALVPSRSSSYPRSSQNCHCPSAKPLDCSYYDSWTITGESPPVSLDGPSQEWHMSSPLLHHPWGKSPVPPALLIIQVWGSCPPPCAPPQATSTQ
jgi:hypothetical protein